jgi:Skp family chaperone for outer membrane proteins
VLQLGKWLLILGIFAAIGYAAHQAGTRLARLDVDRLTRELQALERQRAALEEERARLRTELESARSMQRALQQR